MLAHLVNPRAWPRDEASGRGRVDDMALAVLRQHARHKIMNAIDDPPQVDTQHPLPVGQAALPDGPAGTDPGVIAQQMHGSIGREGSLSQCLDFVGFGNIGTHGQHLCTASLQFVLSLLEGALLYIGQHDLHPLLRALSSQGASYAAGCSSHNSHFVLEILHAAPLLSHKKVYVPYTQL